MSHFLQSLSEDALFRSYSFYCSILVIKMMFMSSFTGFKRITFKSFISPEDAAFHGTKVSTPTENVERVRRAHLNDVENIPLFFVTAFAFCLTNPSLSWANFLFKAYTIARIVHTVVYAIIPIPQPARLICWLISYNITGFMALNSILYFLS
ncbi:hypothetical protein HHI36_003274 [Cryptolaemus montrouzieri]|uniref:Microsomal glutathione S-transferase 1 n=1 Tax=Cryptolaemus montrouzieri TaxID=559131 RepID=A0ABD2PCX6_9CUCU